MHPSISRRQVEVSVAGDDPAGPLAVGGPAGQGRATAAVTLFLSAAAGLCQGQAADAAGSQRSNGAADAEHDGELRPQSALAAELNPQSVRLTSHAPRCSRPPHQSTLRTRSLWSLSAGETDGARHGVAAGVPTPLLPSAVANAATASCSGRLPPAASGGAARAGASMLTPPPPCTVAAR